MDAPQRSPAPVVLLVDDHEDSLEMYTLALLGMGFQPVTALTAEDGFARACATRPDAIVADVIPRRLRFGPDTSLTRG